VTDAEQDNQPAPNLGGSIFLHNDFPIFYSLDERAHFVLYKK
jgi:hypothetical protein